MDNNDVAYAPRLGLRHNPFGNKTPQGCYYTNAIYDEVCERLLAGIRKRDGIIVLTGAAGTGKTAMIQRVAAQLDSRARAVFFYSSRWTVVETLSFISGQLESEQIKGTNLDSVQALYRYLVAHSQQGKSVVLLVDDAHYLDEEVLAELLSLSSPTSWRISLLRTVFIGLPELEIKLNGPHCRPFQGRNTLRERLYPLHPDDVSDYIYTRVKASGSARNDLFDPAAIERIAEYSRGVPSEVNALCNLAALMADRNSRHTISAEIVEEVIAARPLSALSQNPEIEPDSELDKAPAAMDISAESVAEPTQAPQSTQSETAAGLTDGLDLAATAAEVAPKSQAREKVKVDLLVSQPEASLEQLASHQTPSPPSRIMRVALIAFLVLSAAALLWNLRLT